MTIAIASDHAGFGLKSFLLHKLRERDLPLLDLGCHSEEAVDYPDYGRRMADALRSDAERGILICGSGIGMSIAANKFAGVRAAHAESLEGAKLSREHNDANILCLGARLTPPALAIEMVRAFLTTEFSNQPRHCGRIEKIAAIEADHCK